MLAIWLFDKEKQDGTVTDDMLVENANRQAQRFPELKIPRKMCMPIILHCKGMLSSTLLRGGMIPSPSCVWKQCLKTGISWLQDTTLYFGYSTQSWRDFRNIDVVSPVVTCAAPDATDPDDSEEPIAVRARLDSAQVNTFLSDLTELMQWQDWISAGELCMIASILDSCVRSETDVFLHWT